VSTRKLGERNSVGYKQPPPQTQFKPGQSGNPQGRPKRAAVLPDVIAKELRKRVPIVSNGKRQKVSMLEAIVKQLLTKAASGDPKAMTILYRVLKEIPPASGNKLSELVQEFRAVYDRHTTKESEKTQLQADGA
jgi:Family of unknown function (DUF5681)